MFCFVAVSNLYLHESIIPDKNEKDIEWHGHGKIEILHVSLLLLFLRFFL